MKKNEIVLCGGGTGGHLFPALATARVLRDKYHVPVAILSKIANQCIAFFVFSYPLKITLFEDTNLYL